MLSTPLSDTSLWLARALRRASALTATTALLFLGVAAAHGAAGPESFSGADGQTVTVTRSTDLDPAGTELTVTGTGFDETIGIYVAVCVDQGEDARPTPCLGGVDMTGGSGASGWISSNPPPYGRDLAIPFGAGGSFELTTTVVAQDTLTDCLDAAKAPDGCVLATFADHTRLQDRSADVRVPLTFSTSGGEPAPTPSTTQPVEPTTVQASEPAAPSATTGFVVDATDAGTPGTAGSAASPLVWGTLGAVVIAGSGAALLVRRRRTAATPAAEARNASHDD